MTSILTIVGLFASFEAPSLIWPERYNNASKCHFTAINGIEFIYSSCPNNIYSKTDKSDSPTIERVVTYTDSIGGRVSKDRFRSIFNKDLYNVYAIGDSFIQADEIDFSETFYGLSKNNIYNIGMSSWSTGEYLSALKSISKKGVRYDIYLFINDFMPSDPTSSLNRSLFITSVRKQRENIYGLLKSEASRFIWKFKSTARIYRLINLIRGIGGYSAPSSNVTTNNLLEVSKDCTDLTYNPSEYTGTKIHDYVVFSLPETCWPKDYKKAYSKALKDVKEMIDVATTLDSTIRFVYIPSPLSLKYQNTGGRNSQYYKMRDDKILDIAGLRSKLSKDLGDRFVDVSSLFEDILNSKACENKKCTNTFYFMNDGHWTAASHRLIYSSLYK